MTTDIKKLSPAEQTSSLESFHRVICFFAPKSLHFFHAQMEARLFLAALHFNENVNRGQAVTLDGSHQFRVSFPKGRKGEGVAKQIKTRQTYRYIDDLFDELLVRREMYTSYSEAFEARQREDKVRPVPLTRAISRQPKNEIVDRHISRFNLDLN